MVFVESLYFILTKWYLFCFYILVELKLLNGICLSAGADMDSKTPRNIADDEVDEFKLCNVCLCNNNHTGISCRGDLDRVRYDRKL